MEEKFGGHIYNGGKTLGDIYIYDGEKHLG